MMLVRLRDWAKVLKRNIAMLWLAALDPRVPLLAKLVAGLTAAYALSPIDLIPDFIPVLGLLDDLVLLPAGIWLAIRLIPPQLVEVLRAEAAALPPLRKVWPMTLLFAAIWLAAGWLVWRAVSPSS